MNFNDILNNLNKYNVPGGRYTYFPFHSKWNNQLSKDLWFEKINLEPMQPIDLYIHIPFCQSLCTFCGCNIKIARNNNDNRKYIEQIHHEWEQYNSHFTVENLYIGGGTPNFLSPSELDFLISPLPFLDKKNITIELDPRFISKEDLILYKRMGINRLSFGVQDFNLDVLKNVNRASALDEVFKTLEIASDLNFDFINLDFIYGLTFQTKESFKSTLSKLRTLNITGVSLYPFAKVPWQNNSQKAYGEFKDFTLPELNEIFTSSLFELKEQGFKYIGMGFFSKEDVQYHRNIMGFIPHKNKIQIGLGVSAISSTPVGHIQNEKVFDKYLSCPKTTLFKSHLKSIDESEREEFFERLICENFISHSDLGKFSLPKTNQFIKDFLDLGLIIQKENGLMISPVGQVFHKTILQYFDPNF